mgnify:CR=1 FL=1
MPEIKFILVRCPHCRAEYKVRLEKIRTGGSFECVTCGDTIGLSEYVSLVQVLLDYSKIVLEIEMVDKVEGDTIIPTRQAKSAQG